MELSELKDQPAPVSEDSFEKPVVADNSSASAEAPEDSSASPRLQGETSGGDETAAKDGDSKPIAGEQPHQSPAYHERARSDAGNPATTAPAESNDVIGSSTSPREAQASHKISDSEVGQYAVLTDSSGNILINIRNQLHRNPAVVDASEEKSFLALTTKLPDFDSEFPAEVFAKLEHFSSVAQSERLLLVTSYDEDLTRAAIHHVINNSAFGAASERCFLNIESLDDQASTRVSIWNAVSPSPAITETLVYIDATSDRAREFANRLVTLKKNSVLQIARGLRDNRLTVICACDPKLVDAREGNTASEFAFQHQHWRVPFLSTWLQFNYPTRASEMEAAIVEQRQKGSWDADEYEFSRQVKEYLRSGAISIKLDSDCPAPTTPVEVAFRGDGSVEDTVIYAAAYYPRLKTSEFSTVVLTLLRDRTQEITVDTIERGADGQTRHVSVQKQVRLDELWERQADGMLTKCGLEISRERPQAVSFSDYRLRTEAVALLERSHAFFVAHRFKDAIGNGLLFHSSDRIADNVIGMLLDMMVSNPETYGKEWLLGMIQDVNAYVSADDPDRDAFANVRRMVNGASDAFVFDRIGRILSAMLAKEELSPNVDVLVRDLIGKRLHHLALRLVKLLRPTSDGREFGWLRNLLDQADEVTREQVYYYLYRELRKLHIGVHDVLPGLQAWLPAQDRDPGSYSGYNVAALRLVLDLALDSTVRLNAKTNNYGAWPTRHVLLAAESPAVAGIRLHLLLDWLFHPGIKALFASLRPAENVHHLLGALIAEWAFIIIGPPPGNKGEKATAPNTRPREPRRGHQGQFGPDDLLHVMARKVIERTDGAARKELRSELLSYWNAYQQFLLIFSGALHPTDPLRPELNWKRNALKKWLKELQVCRQQLKPLPAVAGAHPQEAL